MSDCLDNETSDESRCSHKARAARLGNELAVDALSELVVHAGIFASLAGRARSQGLELVAG